MHARYMLRPCVCPSVRLSVCLRDGHGLGPSMGWVGLNEKYCGIVAEYCKAHTFHCR